MNLSRAVRPQFVILLLGIMVCAPGIFMRYYPVGGKLSLGAHPLSRPYMFPSGGRELFPRYRLVALYGTPDTPALGALGEQDAQASVARVKALAAVYQPLIQEHVLPTLEIITTVAAATPTEDGDYSYPIPLATLSAWIKVARIAGVYVVLDLQPGRSNFLVQAQQFQTLLAQPNVGLALDPEWRLKPNEIPLQQIGSVSIDEVNQTASWLAELTRRNHLPQKLLLLHQFRLDMLPDRQRLDTTHTELAYAIQMDGQGSQEAKLGTWQAIIAAPPPNIHFGWKNFYTKDPQTRSPEATMQLDPQPWYVSYQ